MKEFYTVEPCTTSNAYEIKFVERVKIDLAKVEMPIDTNGASLALAAGLMRSPPACRTAPRHDPSARHPGSIAG